jgi:hypothetical protein
VIIDWHCHAGRGDGLTGPWDTTALLGPYIERARAAGIDGTVFFAFRDPPCTRARTG